MCMKEVFSIVLSIHLKFINSHRFFNSFAVECVKWVINSPVHEWYHRQFWKRKSLNFFSLCRQNNLAWSTIYQIFNYFSRFFKSFELSLRKTALNARDEKFELDDAHNWSRIKQFAVDQFFMGSFIVIEI